MIGFATRIAPGQPSDIQKTTILLHRCGITLRMHFGTFEGDNIYGFGDRRIPTSVTVP